MRSPHACGASVGCLLLVAGIAAAAPANDANDGHSLVRLNGTDARVGIYEREGRVVRLYGEAFSHGASPAASAEAFLDANANLLGVERADLRDMRLQPMMYQPAAGTYKFTLIGFTQYKADVPVFRGELRLMVRNEEGYPLTWANTESLRDVAAFRPNAMGVDGKARAGRAAALVTVPGLETFTAPELVIWAGVDDMLVVPRLAHVFVGESADVAAPGYQKWLFVTDAKTGAILHLEDQVFHVDVEGNVSGLATQGIGADICGPEEPEFLPYARVNIGGTVAFADGNGDFVIPNPGSDPVTVQSPVRGRFFRVFNQSGPDTILDLEVTPPGPADFLHNAANDNEFQRAEVNAYLHSNVVRDFALVQNPEYPVIANQTEFTVNVNIANNCNAFYNGSSINFYTSGGGCSNTANTTVVYHEYGHHLVNVGGSGQGAYGEGMSDTVAVVITDDPNLALGFQNNCNVPLRSADNNVQYPCSGPIHSCGRLLSGCVWDTRNALVITEPDDYREIIGNLTINSILMHTGTGIDPSITVDFLELDDDDDNIFNGTPHYNEIAAGFGAHNMDAPPIQLMEFQFPNGLPENVSPDGTTTLRVEVVGVSGTPEPGTGKFFVDDGNGVQELAMDEVEPNVYDATFPSFPCATQLTYYFSAETDEGFEQFWPPGAPTDRFATVVATNIAFAFQDDFESDQGWTVENTPGLTTGEWERGVPLGGGDRGDPPTDGDGSGQCYVTGRADGDNDIDDGDTTLISPVMDASDPNSVISYFRWYSNTFGADPENDIFEVEVSDDGGGTWTDLETVGPAGEEVNGGWFHKEFVVSDFVDNTAQFRIRFTASDRNAGSVVEAGVDGVEVKVISCEDLCVGDIDGSGDVGLGDLLQLLSAWGPCEDCPEDLDGDDEVGLSDLLLLLSNWGPCPG